MTCLTKTNPHDALAVKAPVILAQGLFGCKGSDCPPTKESADKSLFFKGDQ